jgi:ABC-type branched-subunit amino acid transport system ATPase component
MHLDTAEHLDTGSHLTMREPILRVVSLGVRFGGLQAVNSLSFDLARGEILGLIGPNGAGKTTCFNAISGVVRPTAGELFYRGERCTGARPFEMAQRGLVRTFQITSLFGALTARENIVSGRHLKRVGNVVGTLFQTRAYRRSQEELVTKADMLLDFVGLRTVASRRAELLSFGEQRRLEIAIAIATEPATLLLDEPAAGLNHSEANDLMRLIRAIRGRGATILLIEHNMRFMMELSERIVVMNFGEKLAEGAPADIAANARVREIYLGRGRSRAAR